MPEENLGQKFSARRRCEQIKRWEASDINKASSSAKKADKIKFLDSTVFLAACSASDIDEVKKLLKRGADINTSNVDGLSALHQACIDDNMAMVEFLVQAGANINQGDNEGWTPLHAAASCGFLEIVKYLVGKGANVASVNSDGELPIDITESIEIEKYLQNEIDKRGIRLDDARNEEITKMIKDVKQWIHTNVVRDRPHPKTGATALHVASAKGYIAVAKLLIEAGVNVDARDFDGWTPLHAAAHWNQTESVKLLVTKGADVRAKDNAGLTPPEVADGSMARYIQDLEDDMKKDPGKYKTIPTTGSRVKKSFPSALTIKQKSSYPPDYSDTHHPESPLSPNTSSLRHGPPGSGSGLIRMSGAEKLRIGIEDHAIERIMAVAETGESSPGQVLAHTTERGGSSSSKKFKSTNNNEESNSTTSSGTTASSSTTSSSSTSSLDKSREDLRGRNRPSKQLAPPRSPHVSKVITQTVPSTRKHHHGILSLQGENVADNDMEIRSSSTESSSTSSDHERASNKVRTDHDDFTNKRVPTKSTVGISAPDRFRPSKPINATPRTSMAVEAASSSSSSDTSEVDENKSYNKPSATTTTTTKSRNMNSALLLSPLSIKSSSHHQTTTNTITPAAAAAPLYPSASSSTTNSSSTINNNGSNQRGSLNTTGSIISSLTYGNKPSSYVSPLQTSTRNVNVASNSSSSNNTSSSSPRSSFGSTSGVALPTNMLTGLINKYSVPASVSASVTYDNNKNNDNIITTEISCTTNPLIIMNATTKLNACNGYGYQSTTSSSPIFRFGAPLRSFFLNSNNNNNKFNFTTTFPKTATVVPETLSSNTFFTTTPTTNSITTTTTSTTSYFQFTAWPPPTNTIVVEPEETFRTNPRHHHHEQMKEEATSIHKNFFIMNAFKPPPQPTSLECGLSSSGNNLPNPPPLRVNNNRNKCYDKMMSTYPDPVSVTGILNGEVPLSAVISRPNSLALFSTIATSPCPAPSLSSPPSPTTINDADGSGTDVTTPTSGSISNSHFTTLLHKYQRNCQQRFLPLQSLTTHTLEPVSMAVTTPITTTASALNLTSTATPGPIRNGNYIETPLTTNATKLNPQYYYPFYGSIVTGQQPLTRKSSLLSQQLQQQPQFQQGLQQPSLASSASSIHSSTADITAGGSNGSGLLPPGISSEAQRKARSKRARESRRSTQGITAEDIKAAEKQLEEIDLSKETNDDKVGVNPKATGEGPASNYKTSTVSLDQKTARVVPMKVQSSPTISNYHRNNEDNLHLIGDDISSSSISGLGAQHSSSHNQNLNAGSSATSNTIRRPVKDYEERRKLLEEQRAKAIEERKASITSATLAAAAHTLKNSTNNTTTLNSPNTPLTGGITPTTRSDGNLSTLESRRHLREKRRSTGICDYEGKNNTEDNSNYIEEDLDEEVSNNNRVQVNNSSSQRKTGMMDEQPSSRRTLQRGGGTGGKTSSGTAVKNSSYYDDDDGGDNKTDAVLTGGSNFKKLYEDAKAENVKLKTRVRELEKELQQSPSQVKDKKPLENRVAELEEELKKMDSLKEINQRLKHENGALIRVISKLSK